ncbi:Oleosin 16 kDa [Camellia lanceoleosa]|uniref:Oleosin 16 kDa n=1 Tax=Camellia lanceoleosa TaxID=1840588 RepID=A0ACC0FI69_9ERIC|nr:Oleosin 16 kDa [Camellia lanceoleosa]
MSDDQSRHITQKPNEPSPTSRHSVMLLTTSAIGAALLFLSGLTLTGTVISLVIATPVLILFSPILFPTGIIIFLATAGFLFSGGCGVAASAALAWLYNYIAGKRRRGAVAEQLDYARMRIASRARDMRERAREYGQKVQQNKAQSQEEFHLSQIYQEGLMKLQAKEYEKARELLESVLKDPLISSAQGIGWRSSCAKVYKHVSVAWYRSLVISLALITPLHSGLSSEIQVPNPSDLGSESRQQLCVDLQTNELWNSSFEDPNHLKNLETKWNPLLLKIKNDIIKKASEHDLETAATLLRCSYNLSRDTSCAVLPSSVNL